MKTLEEKAKEFIYETLRNQGMEFNTFEAMADFAHQEVHKALDEAAEKAESNFYEKSELVEQILSLKEKY